MNIEVAAILNDALRDVGRRMEIEAISKAEPLFVEPCAAKFEADFTSDGLFSLADRCLPELQLSPPAIASKMREWCQENVSELLTLEPSSFGHLNVRIKDEFKQTLLRRFVEGGAEAFFSRLPLVYQSSGKKVSVGDIIQNEPHSHPQLEHAMLMDVLLPKWSEFIERARSSDNGDLRQLVKEFPNLLLWPERMMCLALMADPEHSVEPFLAKYQGRENVPWYVLRFFEDVQKFLQRTRQPSISSSDALALRAENVRREFESNLVTFRYALGCVVSGRDQITGMAYLFGHVLCLIRGFYRFANQPSLSRHLSAEPPANGRSIEELVRLAGQLVHLVLGRLELLPQSGKFVR